jgi:hypothetical protein
MNRYLKKQIYCAITHFTGKYVHRINNRNSKHLDKGNQKAIRNVRDNPYPKEHSRESHASQSAEAQLPQIFLPFFP